MKLSLFLLATASSGALAKTAGCWCYHGGEHNNDYTTAACQSSSSITFTQDRKTYCFQSGFNAQAWKRTCRLKQAHDGECAMV
ncbi:hypothetical protein MCOR27_011442 [Pyricularia oryzae]|uniref:Uncharacterized protein n=2 Tax=Pyricularia TaxID=48558 RepID=A0ABQ8NI59_PYRGI|nr:hypothetical protein MCOR01_002869 [Pyricularia oryzae]KAI6297526.1 hypothetical protein MCOR33_006179 [Pyricularia grisea]KAH9432878.1 hypothetical protein MCOR02_007552 [Pyricularia oryzae]KAI6252015.1 hypothetical protein MCOR19_011363 [Pyricularia oryzae]KAI6265321.1 hypothetical protein MCOR27_011442 [Pyricularia oryzae]